MTPVIGLIDLGRSISNNLIQTIIKIGESMARKKRAKDKELNNRVEKPISKVTLKALKRYMIETGQVTGIYVEQEGEEVIEVTGGWIGLCVLLLGTIYRNYPNNYIKVLIENDVLSDKFEVTTENRKYLVDGIGIFEIIGTDFKLITDGQPIQILNAIKGMTKALEIDNKQIKFDILPDDLYWSRASVEKVDKTRCSLNEIYLVMDDTIEIKKIQLLEFSEDVETFREAVLVLMEWYTDLYGEEMLKKAMVHNQEDVGIVDNEDIEVYEITKVGDYDLFLYNGGSKLGCVDFMIKVSLELGIKPSLIELELRKK